MALSIGSALVAAKNAIYQSDAWVWLAQIDVDGTNGYFICDGDATVSYNGSTYYPYPFRFDSIPMQGDGSLPLVQMTVASVDDAIAIKLDAGYALDRRVQFYQVTRENLSFAIDRGQWTILDATVDHSVATFSIGPYQIFDAPVPNLKQLRTRCQKVYAGTDCGYNTALTNLVSGTYPSFSTSSCDYGLNTSNGCAAHGANEAANGASVRHPNRFGGFSGIPKGPARL